MTRREEGTGGDGRKAMGGRASALTPTPPPPCGCCVRLLALLLTDAATDARPALDREGAPILGADDADDRGDR
jgi:hypothetical protein